jgi:LmbE family N-acetylglucosaminyl deacetylase
LASVLIVAPHADDEVLGCGIAIQHHIDNRDSVVVCVLSNRAYSHEYSDENDEREASCASAAMKVLSPRKKIHLKFLGMKDERLDVCCQDIMICLEEVYNEVRPDVVYLPWAGDMNQDHKAVFVAGTILCRPHQPVHSPCLVFAYEVPSSTDQSFNIGHLPFSPTKYLLATSKQVMRKITAMASYETESRKWPHSRSPDGIMAYATWRGMECGLDMAEAFVVLRDTKGVR